MGNRLTLGRSNWFPRFACFQIEAADVGPLQKIRVGHDGKGMFSGWFLDKVNTEYIFILP